MNKLLSTAAFIGAISLALPASAGTLCGVITTFWSGFSAPWTTTPGNAVWFNCHDAVANADVQYWTSVGALNPNAPAGTPPMPNEQAISSMVGVVAFAKSQQCQVIVSGSGSGLTAVQCQ